MADDHALDTLRSVRNRVRVTLDISRDRAQALGEETIKILNAGFYMSASGSHVDIREQVDEAVQGTVSYPQETRLPCLSTVIPALGRETVIEVRNEPTLAAVLYLRGRGLEPAALNFASATSPGGGFLGGARAQEEYLARSSALWACLYGNPMYSYHRSQLDPFYSDYVIYSPNVPVLRNDAGDLLEASYPCSIITSPAVHALAVRRYKPDRLKDIPSAMWSRILKVLAVAQHHDHKGIVLGAWGCGAFGNDCQDIAELFKKALDEDFAGVFEHVVFAVSDWSDEDKYIGPFRRVFCA